MLIRQTLLYLPAQVAGPFAQLAAVVVWTHWMSPGLYGDLTFVMAAQDLVFLLCLSWWSMFTVRHVSGEADATYRRTEGPVLAAASLAQGVTTIVALTFITTPLTASLAAASVLYAVTRSLGVHLGERARAQSRIFAYTVAQTAGPVFGFGFAFLAVALVEATPEAALLGYGVAQTGALVWLARDLGVSFRARAPDRTLVLKALGFGLPLVAAGAAAWVGLNAIRILVDRFAGNTAMGLVAVGWALGQRLTATVAMFVTVAAFPLAVRSLRSGAKETAVQHLAMNGLLMFGLVLPASVGFILLAEPLVDLFVAAPYRATTVAVVPFAVMAGLARNMRAHVADQVFILFEATNTVLLVALVEAVGVVAGCAIGLAVAGPVGAAAGSCAGYAAVMVFGFALARIRAGLRLSPRHAAWIVLAVALMALAMLLPPWNRVPGGPVAAIALKTLAGGVTYAVAVLAGFPAILRAARLSVPAVLHKARGLLKTGTPRRSGVPEKR